MSEVLTTDIICKDTYWPREPDAIGHYPGDIAPAPAWAAEDDQEREDRAAMKMTGTQANEDEHFTA